MNARPLFWVATLVVAVLILFVWPPLSMVFTVVELITMGIRTTPDSDRIIGL